MMAKFVVCLVLAKNPAALISIGFEKATSRAENRS